MAEGFVGHGSDCVSKYPWGLEDKLPLLASQLGNYGKNKPDFKRRMNVLETGQNISILSLASVHLDMELN